MRKQFIVAFAILAGLGAAAARAFSFLRDMEPNTGLIAPDGVLTIYFLPIIAVVSAIGILAGGFLVKPPKRAAAPRVGMIWLFTEFLAAGLFAGMGVLEFRDGVLYASYARCIYGGLSVFVAASIVIVALSAYKGKLEPSSRNGLWATVPVFWSCFAMVMYFWGHAGQPVLSSYIYGTLAIVCASLAIFGAAGFYFRRGKHTSTQFFTLTALVFAITTLGGSLLAQALATEPLHSSAVLSSSHMLLFGAIIAHMLALGLAIARGSYDFGVPDNTTTGSAPDAGAQEESVDEIVAGSFVQKGPETGEDAEKVPEDTSEPDNL